VWHRPLDVRPGADFYRRRFPNYKQPSELARGRRTAIPSQWSATNTK
jgi:hypothetical protein